MLDRNKTKSMAGFIAISLVLILILAACGGQTNTANTANSSENTTANTAANNTSSNNNTATNEKPATEEDTAAPTEDTSAADVQAAVTVSFAADVLPILESRCANCHGGERTEGGLVLLSYADVMAGGKDGQVVIPGDAAGSLLYDLSASGEMPKRGPKVAPADLALIETWIIEGALDN